MAISVNLAAFKEELAATASEYKRNTNDISIMAVSKTRSVEEIIEARSAGLNLFGENRVEEAAGKFMELDSNEYPLILIGHLQSNKVQRIDEKFRGVHSVDSLKIASKLSMQRREIGQSLEILLQVNTSGEDSKSGFRKQDEFIDIAAEISEMPYLDLKGVMTMAPFVDNETLVRDCFCQCRRWSEDISGYVNGNTIISMGMSSDYKWAVAEGSNLLRIGTTLFGER